MGLAAVAWALVSRFRKQPLLCGYLSCHCPSWDLHRRTFQPPRGRSYRRAWSLVSFSGPFLMALPCLLPLAVPGLPLTPAILIPLSSLPGPPVTRRTLEPLWKLLLYAFSGRHPTCRSVSASWRGDQGSSPLLSASPESGWGEAGAPDLSG